MAVGIKSATALAVRAHASAFNDAILSGEQDNDAIIVGGKHVTEKASCEGLFMLITRHKLSSGNTSDRPELAGCSNSEVAAGAEGLG